jgi:chromosome segregation ATPase
MNPFEALLVPPALVKRALDDLHDVAVLARRYMGLERAILARIELVEEELVRTRSGVESLNGEIGAVRKGVEALRREMQPIGHLEPIRRGIDPLNGEISAVRDGVEALRREMQPIRHLESIRRGIEPLERSMVAVRASVDELEPMVADLDRKLRAIDPKLEEMQDSIEPIGDLAGKLPGNRRRQD